jgi:SAM-dependent methyltransferase
MADAASGRWSNPLERVLFAVRWRARGLRNAARVRIDVARRGLPRVDGLVEEFTRRRVTGWVAVPLDAPPVRVSLHLDGLEVAAAWAAEARERGEAKELRRFDFTLRDIWRYAGPSSRLTVHAGGSAPLPIAGHGRSLAPTRPARRDVDTLRRELAQGYVFGQTGGLQLSKKLDTVWQAKVMSLYGRLRAILAEVYGYDVFFIYGTLLGAVREAGVIGHDLDLDVAYVSELRDGRAAAQELKEIAYLLIERGFDIEAKRNALHIADPSDHALKIDLFHLYFDAGDTIKFPFGIAGTTQIPLADWHGTKEIDFCGGRGLVPVNDEQFVEHIYGAGWRSPNPGFDWDRDRTTRDFAGALPYPVNREIYWANFYAHHAPFEAPSSFFDTLSRRADLPATVIDLGCGDGRDSVAFAELGRTVVGLDWSAAALGTAAGRAGRAGVAERARFVRCDVTVAAQLAEQLSTAVSAADGPVLFYLRLLLGAVTDKDQVALLRTIAAAARPGDLLAAEFRTTADESRPKAFRRHFRLFQDGPAVGAMLRESLGFEVLDEEQGTGLAPYEQEDPDLYRVVARR